MSGFKGRQGNLPAMCEPRSKRIANYITLLFGGCLVLYVDMGQGTAQGLDNPAESPLGDAFPRHDLDRSNTSTELL